MKTDFVICSDIENMVSRFSGRRPLVFALKFTTVKKQSFNHKDVILLVGQLDRKPTCCGEAWSDFVHL